MAPERMSAQLLWFTEGYVEYQIPNLLNNQDILEMLEISLELSSEFPFANNVWPSDITFSLNDLELGTWRSPGDFADTRGIYTPAWYPDNQNQYGLLKTIRIDPMGTTIDDIKISAVTIAKLLAADIKDTWKLRIEVKKEAQHVGGCTLFGKKLGNHPQDIKLKTLVL